MGQTEVKGVTVDHDYDYIDHGKGMRKTSTLDQSAVHSMDVHTLRKHTVNSWNLVKRQLYGCSIPHTSSSDRFAAGVVEQARHMAADVARERNDVPDRQWIGPEGHDSLVALLDETTQEGMYSRIAFLAEGVRAVLSTEPTVVEADVPAKVFGDLHGQFRDMLLLLSDFGFPDVGGPSWVFNGDWVDRGAHQLEVVILVFAFKLAYPDRVFLLRGNHEDAVQNRHMGAHGFDQACIQRLGNHFGPMCFDIISRVFDWLPLGCVVGEKILVVHGGIGDGSWSLDQLAKVQRPLTHDMLGRDPIVYNVLWSDPIPEDVDDSFGVHDSPRDNHAHLIRTFGKDVTDRFCAYNGLQMLIRSHQAKKEGCGYEVMHGGRCVRVFSARDYEDSKNDGCMLSVYQDGDQFIVRPQVLRSMYKSRPPKADVPEQTAGPLTSFYESMMGQAPAPDSPKRNLSPAQSPTNSWQLGNTKQGYSPTQSLSESFSTGNARAAPPPPPRFENPFQAVYEDYADGAFGPGQYYNSGKAAGFGPATPSAYGERGLGPIGGATQQQAPSVQQNVNPMPQQQPLPYQQPQASAESLLSRSRVLPFGVLGTQLLRNNSVMQTGPPPDANTVIVDLASMAHIQPPGGPCHASGMNPYAGQIYGWLGIATHIHFPPDVVQSVTRNGEAKYYGYDAERHVIHVAEPDLRMASSPDMAVQEMADCYCQIFREFARSGRATLRLPPICSLSPANAGMFGPNLPGMTGVAMRRGFMGLQPPEQQAFMARELQICVYAENELPFYESAIHYAG